MYWYLKEAHMHWFAIGVAMLVAVAIIAIGVMYIFNPRVAVQSFGLPHPEEGPNIDWWLRLKGVRDVVAGLVVLALTVWAGPHILGIILLIEAMIPAGDMSVILAAKGSTKTALGIHGLTAALMILAAILLIMGSA
jgi:sterol desaturase/sphingolipid hydroxylase (fatty acid hydroxylase superfamily)